MMNDENRRKDISQYGEVLSVKDITASASGNTMTVTFNVSVTTHIKVIG